MPGPRPSRAAAAGLRFAVVGRLASHTEKQSEVDTVIFGEAPSAGPAAASELRRTRHQLAVFSSLQPGPDGNLRHTPRPVVCRCCRGATGSSPTRRPARQPPRLRGEANRAHHAESGDRNRSTDVPQQQRAVRTANRMHWSSHGAPASAPHQTVHGEGRTRGRAGEGLPGGTTPSRQASTE